MVSSRAARGARVAPSAAWSERRTVGPLQAVTTRPSAPSRPREVRTPLIPPAIRLTHENTSSFAAQRLIVDSAPIKALEEGENILEGLVAFKEKRKPNWVPSKL